MEKTVDSLSYLPNEASDFLTLFLLWKLSIHPSLLSSLVIKRFFLHMFTKRRRLDLKHLSEATVKDHNLRIEELFFVVKWTDMMSFSVFPFVLLQTEI